MDYRWNSAKSIQLFLLLSWCGESNNYKLYCQEKTEGSFVETTLCKRAKEVIEKEGSLLITGHSGYGKSALLHHISANPVQGYHPIPCHSPKEIKKYIDLFEGTSFKLLFVIDEPLGASYIQQSLVDAWVNGKHLEMYLGKHKFLFATRSSVWEDCKVHFNTSPFFANIIEISPASLTDDDKHKLLEKYLGDSGKLTDKEIDGIVGIKNPVAFCQCCRLMSEAIQKGLSGDRLVQIFKKPFSYLFSELQRMEKRKYATLCLIMLCGGQLKSKELSGSMSQVNSTVKERIEAVIEACGCPGQTCGEFQDCAEKLIGTVFEKQCKTGDDSTSCEMYTFSHDSILEAVTMQYGDRHFRHCVQFLPPDLIVKISRPHSYRKDEHEFAIRVPDDVENSKQLAEVFTEAAIVGNWSLHDVFQNPFVREEPFLKVWCEHLKSCPVELRTAFIESKSWDGMCVRTLSARSDAPTLFRLLHKDLGVKCTCRTYSSDPLSEAASRDAAQTVTKLMTSQKQTDNRICQAFLTACKYGSINVIKLLSHEINNDRLLCAIATGLDEACWNGHREPVEFLLGKYYNPCKNETCECGHVMMTASRRGQTDIVHVLVSHGIDINVTDCLGMTGLHHAACNGHPETVRALLHHDADRTIRDRENTIALDHAKWGSTEIEDMLAERGDNGHT